MVRTDDREAPAKVEVIVAVVLDLTDLVLTVKVAEVLPAGMVTVFGAVAELMLLAREITSPPDGAGDPTVTFPMLDLPPLTDAGVKLIEVRTGGVTVIVPVTVSPAYRAFTVATF